MQSPKSGSSTSFNLVLFLIWSSLPRNCKSVALGEEEPLGDRYHLLRYCCDKLQTHHSLLRWFSSESPLFWVPPPVLTFGGVAENHTLETGTTFFLLNETYAPKWGRKGEQMWGL